MHRNFEANVLYIKKAELFHVDKQDEGNSRLRNLANDLKVAYFGIREDKIIFFSFQTDFLLK